MQKKKYSQEDLLLLLQKKNATYEQQRIALQLFLCNDKNAEKVKMRMYKSKQH